MIEKQFNRNIRFHSVIPEKKLQSKKIQRISSPHTSNGQKENFYDQ